MVSEESLILEKKDKIARGEKAENILNLAEKVRKNISKKSSHSH